MYGTRVRGDTGFALVFLLKNFEISFHIYRLKIPVEFFSFFNFFDFLPKKMILFSNFQLFWAVWFHLGIRAETIHSSSPDDDRTSPPPHNSAISNQSRPPPHWPSPPTSARGPTRKPASRAVTRRSRPPRTAANSWKNARARGTSAPQNADNPARYGWGTPRRTASARTSPSSTSATTGPSTSWPIGIHCCAVNARKSHKCPRCGRKRRGPGMTCRLRPRELNWCRRDEFEEFPPSRVPLRTEWSELATLVLTPECSSLAFLA